MDYQYFSCEWLPLPNKEKGMLRVLMEGTLTIPQDFECYLGMGFTESWKTREDGCYIIPFWWRTSSREILEACLSEIGDYITFDNFQSVSQEAFDSAQHERWFPDLDGARDIAELANHNESVLKRSSVT